MAGFLLHNLLLFGRLLRGLGIDVDPGRMVDLAQTLEQIQIERKADFYHVVRSLTVKSRGDIRLFDMAFDLFWREHLNGSQIGGRAPTDASAESHKGMSGASLQIEQKLVEYYDDIHIDGCDIDKIIPTYSAREDLSGKDFSELTGEELRAIERMIDTLTWRAGMRRTRRRKSGRGKWLDMRRILRKNLRYGGELLCLATSKTKYKPRPLVIIADISGSMERYTRFLLHFVYGLSVGLQQQVETFVFSTRLTRVTRHLKVRDVTHALEDLSVVVRDWSGGTRIGSTLKEFNLVWGRRVLSRGAMVMLISDGWDCGDPDLLRMEIARLQRSCRRLIWLNPLLGSVEYEPLTRGMQTAMPFIDDFLPVHNLSSLEDLMLHLERFEGFGGERL